MLLSAEEYLSAMTLNFSLCFDFVFCLRVVDTVSIMSFVNGTLEALISPNHIKLNSYQGIFFLLSGEKLSSISIKLKN